MAKQLNATQLKEVMSLKMEDVNVDLIKDWFTVSDFTSKPKFATNDRFTLPAGAYYNKESIETTVGRYLVNIFVFPKRFLANYGYINIPLTKGAFGKIEGALGEALLNDEITSEDYRQYIDNATWLFLGQGYLLNAAMDSAVITPLDDVIKERDKLFDENAEALANSDGAVINKVESKLMKMASDELHKAGAYGMDYYDSGIGKFNNHYKRTAIMVGGVKNPATGKIEVVKSNFTDGLKKDEYGTASHLATTGGYARAEGTKIGGYSNKKLLNTTAGMELDAPGSDCGTPYTLSITIDDYNKGVLTDRYIVEGGKIVLLDHNKIKSYVGKTVNMRSPMYCKGDKICNKCAGELYYRMATKNAGVHAATIGGTILNMGMEAFHDASIKYYTVNLGEFIE